ncbi:DUF4179 domain-containing protein [Bacillus salitolerans]|uniref:DUF4179 domain-containing protein n=1 Tax=Bacillus salitolerans TaxID=1437434 RepID=A0ABW4LX98_9BACI
MFEKEETQLNKIKDHYDDLDIPSTIDDYILAGIHKGKSIRKRVTSWRLVSLIASILLIGSFSMIQVSPIFAGYLSNIPGFEKVIEAIRFDKGLLSAVEHDFLQPINISDEHDGMKVTVDSIIVDEEKLVLFYTLESDRDREHVMLSQIQFKDKEKNQELGVSHSIESISVKANEPASGTIDFYQIEGWPTSVEISLKVDKNSESVYVFPFSIDKEKFEGLKEEYILNKTVTIENQEITFEKVIIHPTRIAVHLSFNPNNDKEIFNFEDLRIVDGKGESWGSANGIVASYPSEHEWIVYLQSNYFSNPDELYLEFSSVRALDKDEIEVVVDTEQEKILKSPADGRILDVQLNDDMLSFTLKVDPFTEGEGYTYNLFKSEFVDATGATFSASGSFASKQKSGIHLDSLDFQSPITLTIGNYPSRLKEHIRFQIK